NEPDKKLAREYKSRSNDIIAIAGGDGTYQKTQTVLVHVYGRDPLPKIALLGGGTMNNMVNCLKLKGTPETILSRLIYQYHQDRPFRETQLHLLKVNDQYGFLYGSGLLHRFLIDFNKVEGPTRWTAIRMLLSAMGQALAHSKRGKVLCERMDADVTLDGRPWPFKNYTAVFAGTIETLGLGFNALYRARKEKDKFQICAFSLPPRQVVSSFPVLLMGAKVPSENWLDDLAGQAEIHYREPQGYMLDGELYPPVEKVRLAIGPAIQVVAP
ncbi:MAG: hypothetical protein HY466_04860, partial [Deltaproteobacteria bacterium]|nr:hypothetical protein [Deltaproteobacteria bacterium]